MRAGIGAARWVFGLGLVLFGLGILTDDASADVEGVVVQDGDNASRTRQDGDSSSGSAVAGSQVTAVVSSGGDVSVEAHNRSEGSRARSEGADGGSSLRIAVGAGVAPPAAPPTTVRQEGSNRASADADVELESGAAVAGAQTIAVVADGEDVEIVQTNRSEGADARGGETVHLGQTRIVVGPSVGPADGGAILAVATHGADEGATHGADGGGDRMPLGSSGTPPSPSGTDGDRTVPAAFEFR